MFSRRLPRLLALTLIVLMRFAVGMAYSRAVPAWESYDEPWHFAYAAQIATTDTLPSNTDSVLNNERIQPPGYYVLLAAVLNLSGSNVRNFKYPQTNPYFFYGTSGLNYALHPQTLSPDEQQIETALELLRVISLLITLPGVVLAYAATRRLWPSQPDAALLAATIFALWPQSVFNGSVVTNDGPAMIWGALLTYGLIRLARRPSLKIALLCLFGIAFGAFIKINLLAFVLPLALIILSSISIRMIVVCVVVGVALLGGVFILLQQFPAVLLPFIGTDGSPFQVTLQHLNSPNGLPFIGHALDYAVSSSFALFGWGNLPLPDWLQTAWMVAAAIGLVVALWAIIWRRSSLTFRQWLALWTIPGAFIVIALALSLYNWSIHLIPGRYLLPSLVAFILIVVAGWTAISARRLRQLIQWSLIGGIFALNVWIPPFLIAPTYSHPPYVTLADVPIQQRATLAPGIVLLGYGLPQRSATTGDAIPIDLYLEAQYPIVTSYTLQISLVGPDGQGHGILDTLPGNGNYPTTSWAVNQPFRDQYNVTIDDDFPAPSLGHFLISFHGNSPDEPPVLLGTVAIHSRKSPSPPLASNASARFGPGLLLRGATLRIDRINTSGSIVVDLIWQSTAQLPDHTVYVHVEDTNGIPLTQRDQQPRSGGFPFSWWLPGEIVADSYTMPLPQAVSAGRYPIRVGIYDSSNGVRWPVILPPGINGGPDNVILGYLDLSTDGQFSIEQTYS